MASDDLNKELLFVSALNAHNLANSMVVDIEESVNQQLAKIDSYTAQLLELIPAELLDATGEQLAVANFDLTALLRQNKENNPNGATSSGVSSSVRPGGFFSQTSLNGSQSLDTMRNLNRTKTPNKKQNGSATKQKLSSNKKNSHTFKANRHQAGLSSGKKLNWRF